MKLEKITISLILFAAVAVSFIQFMYNRSLWLDEAMLALNIINKGFLELLSPLEYKQVAPVLFLQIEKLFSLIIPDTELGLRLFPLLCYWLALFSFYKIIKIQFANLYSQIFVLSLFVFNSTLIYYSSEVKQYMGDVAVLCFMYFLLLKNYKNNQNRYLLLAIFGVIAIFLSNIAVLILFSIGIYLIIKLQLKIFQKPVLVVFIAWSLSFVINYWFFIHAHPTRNFMVHFHSNVEAFLPTNPFSHDFYYFLWAKFKIILERTAGTRMIGLSGLTFFAGTLLLFRQFRKDHFYVLFIGPIALHLMLSALRLYPFDTRLILYLLPLIMIIAGYGFELFRDWIFRDLNTDRLRVLAMIVPLILLQFNVIRRFPIKNEEIKHTLHHIDKEIKPQDKIYVYYSAYPAFEYYRQIGVFEHENTIIKGSYNRGNNSAYLDEILSINDRVWLLFSHVYKQEEEIILDKLNARGFIKKDSFTTLRSSAHLFDLK